MGDSPETAGVARGIQHATLVLLFVPWLLIGGTAYWYWSRFGRALPNAGPINEPITGPETGEIGLAEPDSSLQADSTAEAESRPGLD